MSSTGWPAALGGLLPNLLATVVLAVVVGLIAAPASDCPASLRSAGCSACRLRSP